MKGDASSALSKLQQSLEEQRSSIEALTTDNSHMKKYIGSL